MNALSRLRSLASTRLNSPVGTNEDELLQSLIKKIGPILKRIDAGNISGSFFDSLVKKGAGPSNPITPKNPDQPVWVKAPISIDIVNLSQAKVSKIVGGDNVKSLGSKDSKISFPKA